MKNQDQDNLIDGRQHFQMRQDERTSTNRLAISGWIRWLKQTLHDDFHGLYCAFSLNTRYGMDVLSKRFEDRCAHINKDSKNHYLESAYVFLLPAISNGGRRHYHGWIRLPKCRIEAPESWRSFPMKEHGTPIRIKGPSLLKDFLFTNRWNSTSMFGDLHVRHSGGRVEWLSHSDPASVLAYWSNTSDGELREFAKGAFIPHNVRTAIPVRKGREPKCAA